MSSHDQNQMDDSLDGRVTALDGRVSALETDVPAHKQRAMRDWKAVAVGFQFGSSPDVEQQQPPSDKCELKERLEAAMRDEQQEPAKRATPRGAPFMAPRRATPRAGSTSGARELRSRR